ncbi:hypothetical protein N9093_01805 [bacterium]|nr:hypothetical protein [bacterium]
MVKHGNFKYHGQPEIYSMQIFRRALFYIVLILFFSPALQAQIIGLGDLAGGDFSSGALGVSNDGSVVVGYGTSSSGFEAFRWEDGVMTGLGAFSGGDFRSIGNAISGDGSVLVGEASHSNGRMGFRWSDGVMSEIGSLTGSTGGSNALGVSMDGSVIVGNSGNSNGDSEPFRWEDGVMTGLGTLAGKIPESRMAILKPFHCEGKAFMSNGRHTWRDA